MELLNIQRMGPLVTRILGQNPGKFTLQGTNTYLIGRSAPYILIDTGEGKPEYIPQLRTTLESSSNGRCPISDIIITHKHQDHHGGLIDVLDFLSSQRSTNSTESWRPPCIHLYPLPTGVTDSTLTSTISQLKLGDFTPKSDCTVFFPLSDGDRVQTADASAMLEVVHTPGHTADSISLILFELREAKSPVPAALFTADTVLGAGTAVFEDLSLYMQSLRRLVELPIWTHSITLHPGHGPVVPPESSKSHIETYISHRQARENQIVDVFKKSHGKANVGHIVESLYAEYPRTLWPAAAHSVVLHLQKLGIEGKIKRLSEKPVSYVGKYDGVKMEQVGAADMDVEWEWTGFEAAGAETKL